MKRLFLMGLILAWAALGAAQNFTLGGMFAIGSVSTEEKNVEKADLKFLEVFAGMFMDESTILQIRAGRMEPRKAEPTQLDLDYVAFTASYMFDTALGQQGFYLGPSYYTGELIYPDPLQPSEERVRESVGKLGGTGGVEGYFPLNQTFNIYGQVSAHYIPIEDQQITFEVGLGLAIRF
jgi:hypothetical protein